MTISALPTPAPSPTDTPVEFNAHAFALLGALPTFITETNSTAAAVNAANATAVAAAGVATTKATAADGSATAAAASAGTATTQAGIATTKAGEASTSAAAALASQNSAAASAAAALGQIFAAGTRMGFFQATAPTGWTRDTSDTSNNRMMRVVSSGGGGTGGIHNPIVNNLVPAHTHGVTTGNESADHTHPINDPTHSHHVTTYRTTGSGQQPYFGKSTDSDFPQDNYTDAAYTGVYTSGRSTPHTHSGTTDAGSSQTNFEPRYVDVIICQKN
nr:hypothetical protein [uncultured Albidiferax sp.]